MKTYNYTFKQGQFSEPIDYSLFINIQIVLIQIFCGEGKKTLQTLSTLMKKKIPQCICVGTTTDGEIIEDVVSTYHSVISISIFENTQLLAHLIEGDYSFQSGY